MCKFTDSKTIDIKYIDFDLNEDGFIDKIVTIRSPLHSGSEGDSLDFLINNKDGTYTRLSNLIIPLYAQSPEYNNAKVCISEQLTNGYHNINIYVEDKIIVLVFRDGQYSISEEAEKKVSLKPLKIYKFNCKSFSVFQCSYTC